LPPPPPKKGAKNNLKPSKNVSGVFTKNGLKKIDCSRIIRASLGMQTMFALSLKILETLKKVEKG
jgi:hypothetical protein